MFQYYPAGTAGYFGRFSIQYVCVTGVCVCVCSHLSYGKFCFPVQTLCVCHYIEISAVICACVCVFVSVCGLLCGVLFFPNGILSMKTSDWTKYHGTHQGRCAQCDCLFLCHHSFLFKQSFNSNRLPKTHLDSALRVTGIYINTLYCTFSITFYKSVTFIIVQSTNVLFKN